MAEKHGPLILLFDKCTYIEFFFVANRRYEHRCDLYEGHVRGHVCKFGRKIGTHTPESD